MELVSAIDTTYMKREKAKEAVRFALNGQWQEAAAINEEILGYYPENTEALNRLGKAYLEVGVYEKARRSFQRVLDISPHNTIARKNLVRLERLSQDHAAAPATARVMADLFLEESGKSGVTELRVTAAPEQLAKVAGGDPAVLEIHNNTLVVKRAGGDWTLGSVEPRLGSRLVRLMKQGNRYEAAVLSAKDGEVSVVIRETYRDLSLSGIPSFPVSGEGRRGGGIDGQIISDLEAELEEEHRRGILTFWDEDEDEFGTRVGHDLVRTMTGVESDSEVD